MLESLNLETPIVTPPAVPGVQSNSTYNADRRQRYDMLESTMTSNVTTTSTTTTGSNSLFDAAYEADRRQRDFMMEKTSVTINLKGLDYSKKASDAWKSGNYSKAMSATRQAIKNETIDVNLARDYVSLAMLQWNCNYKASAKKSMRKAVEIMRTGEYMKNSGCEKQALVFLQKMENDQLPDHFTYEDTKTNGILGYIMAEPQAVFDDKIAKEKHRYEVLASGYESMSNTYRRQGESQERRAKLNAQNSYQQATGKTFSINDPPPAGSSDRKEWDSCKRIYDIFN